MVGFVGAFGDDEFVFHAVFPAYQLGDRNLIAARFQIQTAHDVGDLAAQFTGVQRMPPQFRQRSAAQGEGFVRVQAPRNFRLTARNQHHITRLFLQPESNRVVGGGVAGVQGGYYVDLRGQFVGLGRFGHAHIQKVHPFKAQAGSELARFFDQFGACFNPVNMTVIFFIECVECFEKQIVNNKTQIRFTRAVIRQRCARATVGQFFQELFNELVQVVNLLELAARILVELAIPRQNVQFFQQFNALVRANLGVILGGVRIFG